MKKEELVVPNHGNNKKKPYVHEESVPEYKRLDRKPILRDPSVVPEELIIKNKQASLKNEKETSVQEKSLLTQLREGEISKEEFDNISGISNHSRNVRNRRFNEIPFSGQNNESFWSEPEDLVSEQDANEIVFSDDNVKLLEEAIADTERDESRDTSFESLSEENQITNIQNDIGFFDFHSIEKGTFIIMHNNNVVFSGDSHQVNLFLINLGDNSNVSYEELVILKKMNLRVGIFVED